MDTPEARVPLLTKSLAALARIAAKPGGGSLPGLLDVQIRGNVATASDGFTLLTVELPTVGEHEHPIASQHRAVEGVGDDPVQIPASLLAHLLSAVKPSKWLKVPGYVLKRSATGVAAHGDCSVRDLPQPSASYPATEAIIKREYADADVALSVTLDPYRLREMLTAMIEAGVVPPTPGDKTSAQVVMRLPHREGGAISFVGRTRDDRRVFALFMPMFGTNATKPDTIVGAKYV